MKLEVTKNDVEIDIFHFDDWRDWFLLDKDKKDYPVHKTIAQIYIKDCIVAQKMIPINFKKVSFHISFEPKEDMILKELILKIPEMNINRVSPFDRIIQVSDGDNVNFDFDFFMDK